MEVFKEIFPLREHLKTIRAAHKTIGFVPTMGALHEGHMALVKNSLEENDFTICSVYVNPTQFNNASDLKNYPRELEKDLQLLKNKGCDAVFAPSDNIIYPEKTAITIDFGSLANRLEGAFRPGHFNGVATIVSKLFHIVEPDQAYFGQKDLQQFLIIKQLVEDLSFQIKLRCVEIVREDDGLARSSRNKRLSEKERDKAVVLHQALLKARDLLLTGKSVGDCKSEVSQLFSEPSVKLEYFEVVDANSLKVITNISEPKNVAICVAAFVGEVRLIDNIIFSKEL
ncbi:pantoate--beta-alanine ligase [Fulvivirga sp. RKSG066]|uniref:pantoate--beta-alanine ligase n=1 Tax=Fulvivirga aurantia TaxID=2529383 RepID=UPI0012BC9810|nr:pantoate--beta-alanine ligase [Fulvivirga aurantia]MTI20843.1 pantoate--beta-alanine ligase [Fulvivirga aurantia]